MSEKYLPETLAAATERGQKYFYCVSINVDPIPLYFVTTQEPYTLLADGNKYKSWAMSLNEPEITENNTQMKISFGNSIIPEYGLRLSQIDTAQPKLGVDVRVKIWKIVETSIGWQENIIFSGIILSTAVTDDSFVVFVSKFRNLAETPGTDIATTMCLWPEIGMTGCYYSGLGICNYDLETCRKLVYNPVRTGTGPDNVTMRGENYLTFPTSPAQSQYNIYILTGSTYQYQYNLGPISGPHTILGGWQEFINDSTGNIEINFADPVGTYNPGDIFVSQVSNENNFAQPGLYSPITGDSFHIKTTRIQMGREITSTRLQQREQALGLIGPPIPPIPSPPLKKPGSVPGFGNK